MDVEGLVVMKKSEVRVGGTYVAKVSGVITAVRLNSELPLGGWLATNVRTGYIVRIRTAARLRRELPDNEQGKQLALTPPEL